MKAPSSDININTGMDQVNFNYSLINFPSQNNDTQCKNLIKKKVESFIKRIKWKAFFFERQRGDNDETTANFEFKLVKTLPKNDNLINFKVTNSTWFKILSSQM